MEDPKTQILPPRRGNQKTRRLMGKGLLFVVATTQARRIGAQVLFDCSVICVIVVELDLAAQTYFPNFKSHRSLSLVSVGRLQPSTRRLKLSQR